jgi:TRAP-type mannitol/chloroaromatic compound transport system permease small subunit
MQNAIDKLEQISELSGRLISWLTLFIVLVTFIVVVLRYAFDIGSIALQESISYMHAFVFMLGAAYTLKHDSHVRVDIFYRKMSTVKKARVDLLGTLLLLFPVCLFIMYSSWDYVITSWGQQEESGEAGGLAYVYLLKTTLLLMPLLLMLQGAAIALKSLLTIKNNMFKIQNKDM